MPTAAPTPSATDLAAITQAAAAYNVPLPFSLAIAAQESGISQTNSAGTITTSPTGALGIYQLEPETAAGLGVDPKNEQQNIVGGNKYLGQLLAQFGGNQTAAAEAYNAGASRVTKYGTDVSKWPSAYSETKGYVPAVAALTAQYAGTGSGSLASNALTAQAQLGMPLSGILGGAPANPITAAVQSAAGGATNAAVSAVFNQLTVSGFTEKTMQFAVIVLLIIGGFMILVPRGAV